MQRQQNGQAVKGQYHAQLKERAEFVYNALNTNPGLSKDQAEYVIFQALKNVALESWKNGIEAGKRRSQQPYRKPAMAA